MSSLSTPVNEESVAWLGKSERNVLSAIADTLVSSLSEEEASDVIKRTAPLRTDRPTVDAFLKRRATDIPNLVASVASAIKRHASVNDFTTLHFLLKVLSWRWTAPLLTWIPFGGSFDQLSLAQRESVLVWWSTSRLAPLRQIFQAFKRLVMIVTFAEPTEPNGDNCNWKAIGYTPPSPGDHDRVPGAAALSALPVSRFSAATHKLACDVVVVGSGAGGGVTAAVTSSAGSHVIVLEKGGALRDEDLHQNELPSSRRQYEEEGVLTTTDASIAILAGATLGGGTTLNWCASFKPPPAVLQEWSSGEHNLSKFTPGRGEFEKAFAVVSERVNVNINESHRSDTIPTTNPDLVVNTQNRVLEEGCHKLGYAVRPIPRNVKNCRDCGACCFGCARGAKQDVRRTWLRDAVDAPGPGRTDIFVHAFVEKVLIEEGQAVGVCGRGETIDGELVDFVVRAKRVVVSAGALHTPGVLMRSGLTNPHIGSNLRLHPVTGVVGEWRDDLVDPVPAYRGVMMGTYTHQFANLNGNGYGFAIETPPVHAGLSASAMPWPGRVRFKETVMTAATRSSTLIAITRDLGSGKIRLDPADGRMLVDYSMSAPDEACLVRAQEEMLRVMRASGKLKRLGTMSCHSDEFHLASDGDETSRADEDAAFEAWLKKLSARGLPANAHTLFSAHQMGSARMGSSPTHSAVNPDGETWECKGLYVADCSLFPTALGINPMITCETISYMVARGVAASLGHSAEYPPVNKDHSRGTFDW